MFSFNNSRHFAGNNTKYTHKKLAHFSKNFSQQVKIKTKDHDTSETFAEEEEEKVAFAGQDQIWR